MLLRFAAENHESKHKPLSPQRAQGYTEAANLEPLSARRTAVRGRGERLGNYNSLLTLRRDYASPARFAGQRGGCRHMTLIQDGFFLQATH